jgi:polysaccharide biosynthesis/export protein
VRYSWLIAGFVMASAGCTGLRHDSHMPSRSPVVPAPIAEYRIGCPDVLEVTYAGKTEWDVLTTVDVDGRVNLPGVGKPRVEGLTADEARSMIAETGGMEMANVSVRVVTAQSKRVYVVGPDNRRSRAHIYAGPEPVLDFLKRTDSLPVAESQIRRVSVMRSNVAEGTPARLYRVDSEAILLDGDASTNLPLLPGDRVYIGETRRSSLSRLLPEWLVPSYRKLLGLLPETWR